MKPEDLKNEELSILIGLLSRETRREIDKEDTNYKLIAYYNNIQLKLSLMKKFEKQYYGSKHSDNR